VAAPLRTLGLTAVRNLLALIDGAHPTAREPVMLPSKLVVRESTARRSRRKTAPDWATAKTNASWRGN
jgi:LacI family transcriptional regulator